MNLMDPLNRDPMKPRRRRGIDWSDPRLVIALAILLGTLAAKCSAESFEEMNAQRRHLGLPPLLRDPELMKAAQFKAEWMASHRIDAGRAYWQHQNPDGGFGPMMGPGYTEGIGSLTSEWGWCTCAMRTLGQHPAGTGLAIGEDGKRYMVLLIKGTGLRETQVRRPLLDTSYMTRDAPRIRYVGRLHPGSRFRSLPWYTNRRPYTSHPRFRR